MAAGFEANLRSIHDASRAMADASQEASGLRQFFVTESFMTPDSYRLANFMGELEAAYESGRTRMDHVMNTISAVIAVHAQALDRAATAYQVTDDDNAATLTRQGTW